MDNTFAAQRTIGFFFFFLLGYRLDAGRVVAFVRKVPFALAVAILAAAFLAFFAVFSSGAVPYDKVFRVLTHGGHIDRSSGYVFGMGAYSFAFVGAVVLSVCFLRVALPLKSFDALSGIGSDTMPLYLAHGYVVKAVCATLVPLLPELPGPLLLFMFALLTFGVVVAFSSEGWREICAKAIAFCKRWFCGRKQCS